MGPKGVARSLGSSRQGKPRAVLGLLKNVVMDERGSTRKGKLRC